MRRADSERIYLRDNKGKAECGGETICDFHIIYASRRYAIIKRKWLKKMKQISLCGQWQMHAAGEQTLHAVNIPGSVYSALLGDQSIEDPFYRENELEAFELLKKDYVFARRFDVDAGTLDAAQVILRCEGLDTLAHVKVNGAAVGYADNMHITWEWDVKDKLHVGENEIEITFDSPINYALDMGEKLPGWNSSDATPGFQHIRKAHCMFGWDWGPRLPDAGIWREISLVCVGEARINSVLVNQYHDRGEVTLEIIPDIEGDDATWECTVTSLDGDSCTCLEAGKINIKDPAIWWPAGYGEQPLYTVNVTCKAGGAVQDVWEKRIGLRTVSISREKDQWGEEFCHIINGVKVFAMGADYIPEDNVFSRINETRTRRLLEDAKLANFNTVRIWGGGYYPDDYFYDICDELGLMVWQDFMYACAFYDLTPTFEKSIRIEAEQNIIRLRHHASLALLCGNNEMELFHYYRIRNTHQGDPNTFLPARPSHHADYIKMFEYILPEICARLAPQIYYWPASPSSGGSFDQPDDENRGDVHCWDVWHGEKPFTAYRQFHFRYVSEFGFQSFPSLKTVESFTLPVERNIFSRVMERHQRNSDANGKIMRYMSQTYLYPNSFDNLLYCSQLLQADAIACGVEHWRRNRGRCMGAIIWQLNDIWPVASWASIDYFGRWKALHYAAKRFFAPIMISCREEGEVSQNPQINEFYQKEIERSIHLCVANESREDVRGIVSYELRDANASVISASEQEITAPALSSHWLDKVTFPEASLTGSYVSYAFTVSGEQVSSGTVLFCAPKHFEFASPMLTLEQEGDEIAIHASAYAKYVCIESDDPDMLLSDNFFDMNAGERRVKIIRGDAQNLTVRSVYDLA